MKALMESFFNGKIGDSLRLVKEKTAEQPMCVMVLTSVKTASWFWLRRAWAQATPLVASTGACDRIIEKNRRE